MNWKKWKLGLLVAIACAVLSAGAGLVDVMSWKSFVAVLCTSLLTHLLSYLKTHPIESIKDFDRPQTSLIGLLILSGTLTGCAYYRPTLKTETRSTNGVVTIQELSAPALALWPATTEIAKQKMTVGKTLSLGVDGLKEEGGGTNLVEGLKQLNNLVDKFHP